MPTFRRNNLLGFALPAVLAVTAAMFVLAVAALWVAGVDRGTARLHADQHQAELAARAGLEEVRALLESAAGRDDYLVVRTEPAATGARPAAPCLFLARAVQRGGGLRYGYVPLFSAAKAPQESMKLLVPTVDDCLDAASICQFTALPYQDKTKVAWRPVHDDGGRVVARYGYWLEDLQAKPDPRHVGNLANNHEAHARAAYPFPAAGVNPAAMAAGDVPLDQVALHVVDPVDPSPCSRLARRLLRNRAAMVSPGSLLAAAGVAPPLPRDPASGCLLDPAARAVEEQLVTTVRAYDEQALIPHVPGIEPSMAGTPRCNLNACLAKPRAVAVEEIAGVIRKGLPDFEGRAGGFPEDYLQTLAANVLDYADADSEPTIQAGVYRGLDAYPLLSEIFLQIGYEGIAERDGRKIMTFRFRLFAELVNPTSQRVAGDAQLSYEVSLPMDGIGSGVGGEPFDSPQLLEDPQVATHSLVRAEDRYWSPALAVSLEPNQYRCYRFAEVVYRMDVGAAGDLIPPETPFSLNESKGASGVSLRWNGQVVERVPGILRQAGLIYSKKNGVVTGGFKTGTPETITKAALPGMVYDDYPAMYYNPGDPRATHYLRAATLDENAYPENASPNRRNVRLEIYQNDAAHKPKVYARMMPSEWADGGHDAAVGTWTPGGSDRTEPVDARFDFPYDGGMAMAAPQWISNRGRYYSTTELGRIFDPVMHAPVMDGEAATAEFRNKGKWPAPGMSWPDVVAAVGGPYYGGGHTLRIGRPEHPAFAAAGRAGWHAARLLDLFHVGHARADDPAARAGPLVRIAGHINLNTATPDALRAMAAGVLVMDPLLARRVGDDHAGAPWMAPPVAALVLTPATSAREADRIAAAVIAGRPYASAADIVMAAGPDGVPVFGNRAVYPEGGAIQWSDAAAEETFARMYEAATVRSRNFRVWIVAQALAPPATPGGGQRVLAESRKVHGVFADPGTRRDDGSIKDGRCRVVVTSNGFF